MVASQPRTTVPEVLDLEEYMISKGIDSGDIASAHKYLQMIREHNLRRSPNVVRCGEMLIDCKKAAVKGEKLWELYEQVSLAALDCNNMSLADKCIDRLRDKFPKSVRVGRLVGMRLEAIGHWEEALSHYEKLLEKTPTDQRVMKRTAAVHKGRGDIPAAIEALVGYLDTFMADIEAWEELADLYTSMCMYKQAVFCYEELVVAQPQLPRHHRRIAEVLYTMGGEENMRAARKYFAAAVDMSTGKDVRALYGLVLTSAALKKSSKPPEGKQLEEASLERLEQEYASNNPDLLPFVRSLGRSKV